MGSPNNQACPNMSPTLRLSPILNYRHNMKQDALWSVNSLGLSKYAHYCHDTYSIQLFQFRLSPSKAEKCNTIANRSLIFKRFPGSLSRSYSTSLRSGSQGGGGGGVRTKGEKGEPARNPLFSRIYSFILRTRNMIG